MATVPHAHICIFLAVTFVPGVNNASFNSVSRNDSIPIKFKLYSLTAVDVAIKNGEIRAGESPTTKRKVFTFQLYFEK